MYSVSRGTLRDRLNTFVGDASNVIWTTEQKNLAINRAIASAWPSFHKEMTVSFLLTAGCYGYLVSGRGAYDAIASVTRAPWGPARVFVSTEPYDEESAVELMQYREVRGSVTCRVEDVDWFFRFDKTFLDNHAGHVAMVQYEEAYPLLETDGEKTRLPEDYIIPRALFELCGMEALAGHHTDVRVFKEERPNFFEQAERARQQHKIPALPRTIKVARE